LLQQAEAADPDPVQDFCVGGGASYSHGHGGGGDGSYSGGGGGGSYSGGGDGSYSGGGAPYSGGGCRATAAAEEFRSALLRSPGPWNAAQGYALKLAFAGNFAALRTQGLTLARIDYAAGGGVHPPHFHPRATEALLVLRGTLVAGFVSSTTNNNTLFQARLRAGDVFVFPRGLAHFEFNPDARRPALAIAALNSQNPGISDLAAALLASRPPLPPPVLRRTLGLRPAAVRALVANARAANTFLAPSHAAHPAPPPHHHDDDDDDDELEPEEEEYRD
jgi:hypothetical protein